MKEIQWFFQKSIPYKRALHLNTFNWIGNGGPPGPIGAPGNLGAPGPIGPRGIRGEVSFFLKIIENIVLSIMHGISIDKILNIFIICDNLAWRTRWTWIDGFDRISRTKRWKRGTRKWWSYCKFFPALSKIINYFSCMFSTKCIGCSRCYGYERSCRASWYWNAWSKRR